MAARSIGGFTPSFLELIITQPATASFTTFTKAKTYSANFDVSVTLTDETAALSLADGEVASGSKLGHLTSGAKRLPLALEARVGKSAFQPLDTAVDPQLQVEPRRDPHEVDGQPAPAGQEQGLRDFRKVVLVTLSTETP